MHIILFVLTFIVSSKFVVTNNSIEDLLEEKLKNVSGRDIFDFDIEKLLSGYGYPFQNHEVVTEDGYILGVHRIPYGRYETEKPSEAKTKPVILFMHGLLSNSVDFFILGPGRSLPLMFVDLGYDVWLGNNRGNTWSRKHVTLDPDNDKEFWDFSFHELGVYDLPATIDYILNNTGSTNVSYIGHSQGTTEFFAMASVKPEYNDKINIMTALAPVVFMEHVPSPFLQVAKDYFDLYDLVTNLFNVTEVLSHSLDLSTTLETLCQDSSEYQELCVAIVFLVSGFDSPQLNRSIVVEFVKNFPAGSSVKETKHYLQEIKSGYFRQYDYGEEKNLELYGQNAPPDYNISDITVPIALYYGQNDFMAGTFDVERLAAELPNVVKKYLIGYEYFSHVDFIFAKDVVVLLYIDVINLVNYYNGLS